MVENVAIFAAGPPLGMRTPVYKGCGVLTKNVQKESVLLA